AGVVGFLGVLLRRGGGCGLGGLHLRAGRPVEVAPALHITGRGVGVVSTDLVAGPGVVLGEPVGPVGPVELLRARVGLAIDGADHAGLGVLRGEAGGLERLPAAGRVSFGAADLDVAAEVGEVDHHGDPVGVGAPAAGGD